MKRLAWGAGLLGALLILCGCSDQPGGIADVKQVSVGGFSGSPSSSVDIRDDGSTAVLTEDASRSPVSLDGPAVAVPEEATELSFDYDLQVPGGSEDYFQFYLGDAARPLLRVGGPPGTYADHYRCNVSPHRGGKTRLVFSLMSGWGDQNADSRLTLRNVRFQ